MVVCVNVWCVCGGAQVLDFDEFKRMVLAMEPSMEESEIAKMYDQVTHTLSFGSGVLSQLENLTISQNTVPFC